MTTDCLPGIKPTGSPAEDPARTKIFFFNEAKRNDPGTKRLIEQLLMFEKGSRYHDDAPDAVEGAIWMLNFKSRVDIPLIIGKRNEGKYRNIMRF